MTSDNRYEALGIKPEDVFVIDSRNAAFLAGRRTMPAFAPPSSFIVMRSLFVASISCPMAALSWLSWSFLPHEHLVYLIAIPLFLGATIIWLGPSAQVWRLISNRHSSHYVLSIMRLIPAIIVSGKPDDHFIIPSIVFFLRNRLFKRSTFLYYVFNAPDTGQEVVCEERVQGNFLYQPLPPPQSTVLIAYFDKPIRFWSKKRQMFIL